MITVYFDTETGGTEPKHPTIELASVAIDGGVELGSFQQRIAFSPAECDPEALAMNHYDAALWTETAVSATVCAAKFAAWLRPFQAVTLTSKRTGQPYTVARLAGYNAATFDLPRLKAMFNGQFFPCEYLVRDVLQLAVWHFDRQDQKPENFKLSTVAAYFGIPTDRAHGALADARMAAAVAYAIQEAW